MEGPGGRAPSPGAHPMSKLGGLVRKVLNEVLRFSDLFLNRIFQLLDSAVVSNFTKPSVAIEYQASI